jgi:hypothetical protein
LPPDIAPRATSVAKVSASAPIAHRPMATGSAPPEMRVLMIRATPAKPAISPAVPSGPIRSPANAQPAAATSSGMVEAMIAATDASSVCIATQLSPR